MINALNNPQLKSDVAHLNQEGYKQVAMRLAELVPIVAGKTGEP